MYEVVTFDESHRSWFIGETVKSDGSLFILTPVNPTYLGKYVTVSQDFIFLISK